MFTRAQLPPDRRLPRGLLGLAGLRADAPSEARGAGGERAGRPRGGRRSGGAAAVAGDLAGLRRWLEIWRAVAGRRSGGLRPTPEEQTGVRVRKTGDPKAAGCLCVMGDLNPQPAD